jgi:ABC-type polysaccharide/polyol phosphate export permease
VTQVVGRPASRTAPSLLRDLARDALVNLRSSFDWAWLDMVCQYRRSRIGPFWETINVAVLVAGLSVVTAGIFGGSIVDKVGYIGLGMIVWSAISSLVMEGCSTFVRNAGHIQATNISIDLYIGRTVFKTFITFGHQLLLYAVGLVLGFVSLRWTSLLALPGLFLIFINGYWIVVVLGFLCARFRDLEPIIRNLLQLAFLVTPIFWSHEQLSARFRYFLVDYNPLYHFIALVRAPLLGEVPQLQSYLIAIALTVFGYIAAYIVYRRMRRRLAFFV